MKPSPPLDRLLQAWAERHAPDAAALNASLARRLAAERFLEVPDHRHPPRPTRLHVVMASVLAVLLAGVAMLLTHRPAAAVPNLAALSSAELSARAELYRGVRELFGERLAGLDLSANRLQMNLVGAEPADARDPSRPLLVRLAALESDGRGGWQVLWNKELVTFPQEVLRLPAAGGAELLCWICPTPDGKLVVESEWSNGSHAAATRVVTPGTPGGLIDIASGPRARRIVQSIDWLPLASDGRST